LNDQNQAIVDLYDGSKYWSDKATEKIKELEKENEQLKKQLESEHTMLDNAILLERTRMGQNSLKQFKESLR
jgi:hypothetical protein